MQTKKVRRKEIIKALQATSNNYIFITFLDEKKIHIKDRNISLIVNDLGES